MKKILVILFTIFTLTLLFNNKVFCEETTIYTEGSFQYIINDDNDITIVKYNGNDREVTVPRTIGTYNVTTIEAETFTGSKVRDIRLPDSLLFVYDTNVESMKVTYYDIFDNDIKKEDGKDIVIPEEKREETSGSQNTENPQNTQTNTSQTQEEVSEKEKSSVEEIDTDAEISSNSAYYVSEVKKAPSSNPTTILVVSFVVVLIIIAVLIIIKKKINKKN